MTHDDHPGEGELVRLLHDETGDVRPVRRHLEGCPACRERLAVLERRQERLGELLASTAPALPEPEYAPGFLARLREGGMATPAPREDAGDGRLRLPFTRTKHLRWAAALALLAVGVSIAPVRAWVGRTAGALWTAVTGGAPGIQGPAPVPGGDEPTEVRTRLAGTVLEIEIGRPVALDSVAFRKKAGESVVARLSGGGAEAEILVVERGFRIVAPESGARLAIGVPATVEEVVISVDEEIRWRLDPGARADSSWSVALDGG